MTIDMTVHTDQGVFMARIPDPDRIPIKAVREDVAKLADRLTKQREAQARFNTAVEAQRAAEQRVAAAAADAADDGGEVPTKKLAKALRDAEDELAEAKIEHDARQRAATKAHGRLIETIQKHTPAWRDAALKAADRGILKVTTARRQLETAAAELTEPLEVLGMLGRIPVDRLPVMTQTGKSAMYVDLALGNLTAAIGEAMETYDGFKGAAASTPDVEVVVPVEEPLTISVEGDDDGEA